MSYKLFCLALLATAQPAMAADTAPASDTASPAVSAAAKRFGELYVPLDLGLESAVTGFDREFEPVIRRDPNVTALDQRYPGLIAAVGAAGRKTLVEAMRRELPGVQKRFAAFAATQMSDSELESANAYLASSAGRNLQRAMAETADTSGLRKEMAATGGVPQLDGDKLLAMMNPAALARLSKEDLTALIQFSATPAGKKFNASGGVFADRVASEMNGIIARIQPDIEQAVVTAITAHIGKK